MTLPELFIRKPIMTTLLMVVVSVFGVYCYLQLPVSSLPTVDYPVITVTASYPGASPETMASTVATPLENQCMQINGLQSIISDNRFMSTTITLTFDINKNVDLVAPDVQAAISRASSLLPPDLPSQPTYSKTNPSDKPIMYLMVSSDTLTLGQLYDYANRMIAKRINIIDGVSQVNIYGSKGAIHIQVDPEKLAAYDISLAEISQAIQSGTVQVPGGSLNGKYHTYSIQPFGQLQHGADWEPVIVAYRNGAPVRMGDIANCIDSLDSDQMDTRYGLPPQNLVRYDSICLAISRQSGVNTVQLARNIRNEVDKIRQEIPGSVHLDIMYDGSGPIVESIDDVQTTILIAIGLVVLIIFLFLGRVRETIIPSMVLPIALLTTFIIMQIANFSLDTLSLMALVLSVGFLVDDAIVVLENTVRHIEHGLKPIPAAIRSMTELTGTVISTSVALIIVFVPLVFMPGVVGRNFKEFALTAVFAIIASTLLALSLTPMMCSRLLKDTGGQKNRFQKVIDKVINALIARYGVALHWTLRHRWLAIVAWVVCIGGAGLVFSILPKDFIPPGDSGTIFGVIMTPLGASSEQMQEYQTRVQALLMQNTNIANCATITGTSPGADQSSGYIIVCLKPRDQRPPIDEVANALNAQFYMLPNGMVFMQPIAVLKLSTGGEATASGANYSYTMRGSDRDVLYATADKLQARMYTLPGFQGIQTSVKLNLPQLNVNLNRDRASTLGITAQEIETTLALAYAQGRVTIFSTDSDQYDVDLEVLKKDQRLPPDLNKLYLRSSLTQKLVPFASIVDMVPDVGPQNVPHLQQMDAATISFNIDPKVPLGDATKALNKAAQEILPPEVTGQVQGQAQEFEEAIQGLVVMLGVAIFLMYIVLGILYESYIHPFTILTTLPVGAFGGVLTLLLFNSTLNLYAYIGMFTLLGIIAKNGILMVDFAIEEKATGKSAFDAIYNACLIRFRPILMTGMSTIFGTLPIALGYGADASSRIPLGLIVVGGMVFAQVITLFVTPGIYLYMEAIQERFPALGGETKADGAGVATAPATAPVTQA